QRAGGEGPEAAGAEPERRGGIGVARQRVLLHRRRTRRTALHVIVAADQRVVVGLRLHAAARHERERRLDADRGLEREAAVAEVKAERIGLDRVARALPRIPDQGRDDDGTDDPRRRRPPPGVGRAHRRASSDRRRSYHPRRARGYPDSPATIPPCQLPVMRMLWRWSALRYSFRARSGGPSRS